MRKLIINWRNLRIKWKLTFGAGFMFFVLFSFLNFFQYQFVNHWVRSLEKSNLERSANDVVTFINTQKNWGDQSLSTLSNNLSQLSGRNELIQLYKSNGQLITQVTNSISTSSVALRPQFSSLTWKVNKNNHHLMVVQRPFKSENLSGILIVAKNMDMYENLLLLIQKIMFVGGLAALIISLLTGLLLSSQLLKPIKNLKTTIERIQRKGLHERVELPNNYEDELTSLSLMFNNMMDKVEMSFNTQKQFIEDASHELRTPLSILEGHLSLINRWGKDDRNIMDESLHISLHELTRIKGLVNDLLDLSKSEEEEQNFTRNSEILDLLFPLKSIVHNFSLLYDDFSFQLNYDTDNSFKVSIGENHFEQIITILLDNAVKYSKDKKEVVIQLEKKDDLVLVSIKDWGMGIPKDELNLIFNRFYRVDKARSREIGGNGLGLSIAKQLVQNYKGDLVIESEEGVGTVAIVIFKQALIY